jgi:hypothetical protein
MRSWGSSRPPEPRSWWWRCSWPPGPLVVLDEPYDRAMRADRELHGSLQLAAKAADRVKVADTLGPDFERRLKDLGYSQRGIAHALSLLSGPGTVADAREVLERYVE